VSGASVLTGGSIDGSVAYKQLRASTNPYDPKFEQPIGTATVEPIVPMPNGKSEAPSSDDQHPRNT
ncbi:MAG TPA: sel1 repeat family protein, partial [Rhodanobacteraceae bacterium]|nr:sel1 repeat family protein [Rhodanobacteraceae bacterium]